MTYRAIIVPLIGPRDDPDLVSERALPVARALVSEAGGTVVFVSVVDRSFSVEALDAALNHNSKTDEVWLVELRDYLEGVAATFHGCNAQVVIRPGTPVAELEQEIQSTDNPLVVMASHGRVGMERMLLGSVSFRVIHDVDCPVVLVRERLPNAYALHNLLVPLDGSPAAESALDRALDTLEGLSLRLRLLHVVEPLSDLYGVVVPSYLDAANQWAASYLRNMSQRLSGRGYEVSWLVRHGFVAEQIAEAAIEERVDLVVLSTEGRHAVRRMLFGSVTERTLHEGVLPLMIVRPYAAISESQ